METREVSIAADPGTSKSWVVETQSGIKPRTVYVEIVEGNNVVYGWFTEEALDDLITVLQFAKLERFEND